MSHPFEDKVSFATKYHKLSALNNIYVSDTTERLHFHFSLLPIGEGNGNPLQCSCLENPRDGGAWWAAVYGVAQSQTRLKRLRSSSSNTSADKVPGVSRALLPLKALGKNLSQAFFLVSGGLLAVFGLSWFVDTSPWSVPSCSHRGLPVCFPISVFCGHQDNRVGWKSNLLDGYDLILGNYTCMTLFPNKVTLRDTGG